MKAMALVAHPDDCVIFAYPFIHAHPELDWTVCYLTYEADDYRGSELCAFWDKRNIKTQFLGYVDDWHDIENNKISFDEEAAWRDIQSAINDQDILLTHSVSGETGHPHHIFVNRATAIHPSRITFAEMDHGTDKFTLPPDTYSLDELPWHGKIIEGFHRNHHTNEYDIPSAVKVQLAHTKT